MSTAEIATPKRHRRLWLFLPWAAFVALVIAWIFYWFALAQGAEQRLAAWRDGVRRQGGDVTYAGVKRHGFPVLLRLEIDGLAYRAPHANWRADTRQLDLNIEMVDPSHVIFSAKAPITLTHADGAVNTITADSLIVSLHNRGAALTQDGAEAVNVSIADSGKPGVLRIAHLTANVRPDPDAANQYQLALSAANVTLARPVRSFEGFGQTIANLDAGVVIEQGAALAAPNNGDTLAPWRAGGGKARLEFLSLHWGALEATGTGEASLDDQRRLTGHVRIEVPHAGEAVAALAQGPGLSHDTREALNALALGLALRRHAVGFDIDAGDGALRIDHNPVRTLDPLY